MVSSINSPGADNLNRLPTDRQTGPRTAPGQIGESQQTGAPATIRTPADGIALLRARLDQKLADFGVSSSGPKIGQFEPPSASEVANRVLGFVQNRLQQEADNGASEERLSHLLEQARSGVEKGFSEARDQIQALGLLDDNLAADINDSYTRVHDGLDALTKRFVGGDPADTAPVGQSAAAARLETAASDSLSFTVKTRDGDRVTVNVQEQSGSRRSGYSVSGEQGGASAIESESYSAGRYEFTVDGELDGDERDELAALLKDVQGVSKQFFNGNVQDAFEAAQSLNLDGDELASFSLNLSSVRSVRASTYSEVGNQPSTNDRLRPIAGLGQAVRDVGERSQKAGLQLKSLQDLVNHTLEDIRSHSAGPENGTESLKTDFLNSIINALRDDSGDVGANTSSEARDE